MISDWCSCICCRASSAVCTTAGMVNDSHRASTEARHSPNRRLSVTIIKDTAWIMAHLTQPHGVSSLHPLCSIGAAAHHYGRLKSSPGAAILMCHLWTDTFDAYPYGLGTRSVPERKLCH